MNLIALTCVLHAIGLGGPSSPPPEEVPTVELAAPQADSPLDLLDAATACFRRAQLDCARATASQLLALEDLAEPVARDALIILAQSESRLDNPRAAEAAFRRLFAAGSNWRPDPDADARVFSAWTAARRSVASDADGRVLSASPAAREPMEVQPPSAPPPEVTDVFTPQRFFASVGAGVALPVGTATRRYDPGLTAFIDLGWRWSVPERGDDRPLIGLVLSFALANLGLNDTILAESGQATTLRATTLTLGLDVRIPFAPAWQVVLQGGLGYGVFAIGDASSGPALALQGSLGARWQLADAFALRADFTPVVLIPFKTGIGTAGHPAFALRAEASF